MEEHRDSEKLLRPPSATGRSVTTDEYIYDSLRLKLIKKVHRLNVAVLVLACALTLSCIFFTWYDKLPAVLFETQQSSYCELRPR